MEKSKALQNKLQAAINSQKLRMNEATDYVNFLKGKQYPKTPKKDEATFNICHSTVQAILNSVLRGNSFIYVDPDSGSPEAVNHYQLVEKVINYWWKKLKVKYQLELSTIDYAALGLGVSYTDWDFQTDEEGRIVKDSPFVLHIPYEDFLIDPEARIEEIYEAKYMIRKFIKSTKELKKDSRYKHTKNIKGDVKLSNDIYKSTDDSIERSTLYQIWVLDEESSYVMRQDSEDILREVENKFGREYPFTLLQNYKMPGELFPFGEVKILYEPQKILNRIFTLILTHAKRVSTRQYTANDMIKIEETRKLKDAQDGEVLRIEGNSKANDVISPIQDAPLSGDVYRAYELINSAIVQLTSISEYRRAIMPQQQRKATEASFIEQGTELSVSAKGEDVAEHCEEIARKLFKLLTNENNINMQQITYKDEKTGKWLSSEYNNESFPGEYSFRWESGVQGPINASTRQQKALALLDTLANITRLNPQVTQRINWTELLRSTLTSFEIKNLEEILTPEEIPQEMENMEGQPMEQGQVSPEMVANIASKLRGGY
jgi:hypothetical protein